MIRENRPRLHQCSSNLKKDFQKKSNLKMISKSGGRLSVLLSETFCQCIDLVEDYVVF